MRMMKPRKARMRRGTSLIDIDKRTRLDELLAYAETLDTAVVYAERDTYGNLVNIAVAASGDTAEEVAELIHPLHVGEWTDAWGE